MNRGTLLARGLRFHWRAHIPLMLGVAVGAAVLTGALLVGDSLRGSLRARAERQLGGVNSAVFPGRFVRETLSFGGDQEAIIYTTGTIQHGRRRATNVIVHTRQGQETPPGTALLPAALADELGVADGDEVQLRLRKPAQLARESLFGRKSGDDLSVTIKLRVRLAPGSPLTEFNLAPQFGPPRSIAVRRTDLQGALGEPGRVNTFLVGTSSATPRNINLSDYELAVKTPAARTLALLEQLDRDKSGSLDARETRRRLAAVVIQNADLNQDKVIGRAELESYFQSLGYFALETKGLLLSPAAEKSALDAARALGLKAEPALVYLANSIADAAGEIPYSVLAAAPTDPPLADDEILLADWAESPLTAKPGDRISVNYFLPESEGKPVEATATFKLRARVPMAGRFADPYLTPEFPGITDKLSLGEWDPPFPYDNKRIARRDDDYWERYRTTPKAYISPNAGRKLFGSRWGHATSVRVFSDQPADAAAFEKELLKRLDPADFGFAVEDVRGKALAASQGGTDFGGLFLGFSLYLIVAALLLVALLTKLNVERRAQEVGLLMAAGYRVKDVRRLLLGEALIVAGVGAAVGVALALAYAKLMLLLLARLWPEGSVGAFLEFHAGLLSLLYGYGGTLLSVAVTLWLALRWLRHVEPVRLLRGVVAEGSAEAAPVPRWPSLAAWATGLASLVAGSRINDHEARAGTFFVGGALVTAGGLLELRLILRNRMFTSRVNSTAALGTRNLSRNPTRSLLTAGVLASATFLLLVTDAFRRSPESDFATQSGGSGGYALMVTADVPWYHDPGSGDGDDANSGRGEAFAALRQSWQGDPAALQRDLAAAAAIWNTTTFMPLRVHGGDEAGCRNLYRPTQPRLVAVPQRFIERGGFHFAKTLATAEPALSNPWRLLERRTDDPIPVLGEANTVTWMLHKSLGDVITVPDAAGRDVRLQIVGLLKDSIFQGELVMAETPFLKAFPETQGYSMLLAETQHVPQLRDLLETAYGERGVVVTPTAEILRSYLAIENTYLSTFQILGGFGLLLGVSGLIVVLIRAAWERRGELALLRAVGFRSATLRGMAMAENALLLFAGVAIGLSSALLALVWQGLTTHQLAPLLRTGVMIAAMIIAGLLASLFTLAASLRAPIVPALRDE